MIKPFKGNYPQTRGFASSIRLANDAKYGSHKGVDWALPTGTKLYAAQSGRVTWAGDAGDAGLTVTIESGNLLIKCFHMSQIAVKHNQQVKEGDFIGLSGNSGNSTGPHLHFQVESFRIPVDPLPLITNEIKEKAMPEKDIWQALDESNKDRDALWRALHQTNINIDKLARTQTIDSELMDNIYSALHTTNQRVDNLEEKL